MVLTFALGGACVAEGDMSCTRVSERVASAGTRRGFQDRLRPVGTVNKVVRCALFQ